MIEISEPLLATKVDLLLSRFRLLEATGLCEALSTLIGPSFACDRSAKWWKLLAQLARNYRTALLKSGSIAEHGLYSLVMLLEGPNSENRDLVTAVGRAHLELEKWATGIVGGSAYLAFLEGCVGFEELDGDQAMDGLARCLELTQQLAPLTEELSECLRFAKGESDHLNLSVGLMSSYDVFQATADYMTKLFELPVHAFSDVQRFALRPTVLREWAVSGSRPRGSLLGAYASRNSSTQVIMGSRLFTILDRAAGSGNRSAGQSLGTIAKYQSGPATPMETCCCGWWWCQDRQRRSKCQSAWWTIVERPQKMDRATLQWKSRLFLPFSQRRRERGLALLDLSFRNCP